MKSINIKNLFLPVIMLSILIATGCTKDDGPIRKEYLDLIDAVPAISTAINASGDGAIDVLNPSAFQGSFTVSEHFSGPGSFSPEKVDVVVRKNGGSGTDVRVFAANVTSLPATYSVTAAQIESIFSAPIALGDNYDFSVDIYANGKKYEAFPAGGASSSSGPTGQPGFSLFARYGAICAYDPSIYEGDFEVTQGTLVSAAWVITGETVTLTRVSDDTFSFNPYATVLNSPTGVPIIVKVNRGNNLVTVTESASLGSSWRWNAGYDNPFVRQAGAVTASYVAPCDETLTIVLDHRVGAGSFGAFSIILKKK